MTDNEQLAEKLLKLVDKWSLDDTDDARPLIREAAEALQKCHCITLSPEAYKAFVEALDSPPKDNEPLRRLLQGKTSGFDDARVCPQDGSTCWGPCDVSYCRGQADAREALRKRCVHCWGDADTRGKCHNDACIGSEFSYEDPGGWPTSTLPADPSPDTLGRTPEAGDTESRD